MPVMPETMENAALLYDRIETYIAANGYSPTVREVGKMLGTPSSHVSFRYLKLMRGWGWLDWQPRIARTITLKKEVAR